MTYAYATGADVKAGSKIKVTKTGSLYEVLQAVSSPNDPRFISATVKHIPGGHQRQLFISKTKEILIEDADGEVTEATIHGHEDEDEMTCTFPKRGWCAFNLSDSHEPGALGALVIGRSVSFRGTRSQLTTIAELLEIEWNDRTNSGRRSEIEGTYDDYYSCKEAAAKIRKELAK